MNRSTSSDRGTKRLVIIILTCALAVAFVYNFNRQSLCPKLSDPLVQAAQKPCEPIMAREKKAASVRTPPKTWYEVAATTKTDKITTHAYDYAYDKYLPQFYAQGKVKLLEIGLGCDMVYGPGESLKLWLEYFKGIDLELHFMEYDEKCAREWQPKFPNIKFHVGDQANPEHLQRVLDDSGANFDVVIDDGGHTMQQQIVSLEYLLPRAVRPGGIYILEDLISSFYSGQYNGHTTDSYVNSLVSNMHKSEFPNSGGYVRVNRLHEHILSMEAMRGILVFTKMPKEADIPPGLRGKNLFRR
jgi:hypothetical protein